MIRGNLHADRVLQVQVQGLAAVDRQLLQLRIPRAVGIRTDPMRGDRETWCLSREMDGIFRGRALERKRQTVEHAVANLKPVQTHVDLGLVLLAWVEVDVGVERIQRNPFVMNSDAMRARADCRILQRAANCAVGLQLTAAPRGEETQILGLERKPKIDFFCDAAVQRDTRATQPHAHVVELPGVGRTAQLSAPARGDATQSAADVAHFQTEVAVAREAGSLRRHGKADGTRKIRSQVHGIHACDPAVHLPPFLRSPDHRPIQLQVAVEGLQIGFAELEAVLAEKAGDLQGNGREGARGGNPNRVYGVRQDTFQLVFPGRAVERRLLAEQRPAKVPPGSLQVQSRTVGDDADGAGPRGMRARGLVSQLESLGHQDAVGVGAFELSVERACLQSRGDHRAACPKSVGVALQGQLSRENPEGTVHSPLPQVEGMHLRIASPMPRIGELERVPGEVRAERRQEASLERE